MELSPRPEGSSLGPHLPPLSPSFLAAATVSPQGLCAAWFLHREAFSQRLPKETAHHPAWFCCPLTFLITTLAVSSGSTGLSLIPAWPSPHGCLFVWSRCLFPECFLQPWGMWWWWLSTSIIWVYSHWLMFRSSTLFWLDCLFSDTELHELLVYSGD